MELAEESAYTKAELAFYESYWDQVRREKTLMSEKYTTGLEVGKAEGKAEGLAEGAARGKAEGKAEVAKRMLKRGASLEVIVEDTGLTYQELEQIKNMR